MLERFFFALLLACALPAQAVDIKDDLGQTTVLAAPPQRIVSLLPSLTETVCELGACARLVGVDRYSNFPAQVNALPKLGGMDDTNVELIASLKPDVVLVAVSSRVAERLRALGLKVVALEPRSYKDVQRVLGIIGRVLAVPDAQRVWRRIEAGVAAAASSVPPAARGIRVYYEVASGLYAAGESSFMGETLARLGAGNIIPSGLGPFPKINPEFVVKANPGLIMVGDRGAEGLAERPGWNRIDAVRNGRICVFKAEDGDVLSRPGPRMAEAAQIMARCLREKAAS
ncbi:ABC transporter substrate-binding protein [Roseateles saccharophilus]|uniref:Iron complex transport system substrate-binding protein n=1 Tax=Roseateles saccharophilus TaxID=304 RepID=A0A4R3UWS2_ROSSA|nr:helical backbone metal receptor [Roseateles saccharophilus]MDG0833265.1 ABC transporter substrate-binding protein [Roseateles saccharophilus]TCU94384.1 iron complex transport system substrate-binding protein [Roseateles saccharophilus]